MPEESKWWYLENFNSLKQLPKEVLVQIEEKTTMCTIVKDDFIYFPDDPAETLYLLKEGKVKIGSYSVEGKEVIKAILQPGEIFGELSLFGEDKRKDFAQAMERALICKISLSDFTELMENNANLSLQVSKIIGLRLRKFENRLESLVFKDARTRIVDFLKDMARERGEKVGFEVMIRNYLTHQDIANLTATSRQTVTTVLNELKRQNQINFNRRQILIRDLEHLN